MAGSVHGPGTVAQVSHVPSCLPGDRDRHRTVGVRRRISTDTAGDPLRGATVISCDKTPAPPHRVAIRGKRSNTMRKKTRAQRLRGLRIARQFRVALCLPILSPTAFKKVENVLNGEALCESVKKSLHACGLMIKPRRQLSFIPLSLEILGS